MGIWIPRTEAELREGLLSRDIPEGHQLDFKRELGNTSADRKETARDLASFAIDGGVLIVGVAEPGTDRFELAPQPLPGLSERAEQIAANRSDPSLHVRTHIISSEADPSLGYLVIEVPPSPGAPHMVDGRYLGRAERTKRTLSDAEVVRLHQARVEVERRLERTLAVEIDREPTPRPSSRMSLVAQPLAAPPEALRRLVRGDLQAVSSLLNDVDVPDSVSMVSPGPWDALCKVRRARGAALTNLDEARTTLSDMRADTAVDIELQVSGTVSALVTPMTGRVDGVRESHRLPVVFEGAVVAWVHRMLGWAQSVSREVGYRGQWGFAVHIYGIKGVRASPAERIGRPPSPATLMRSPVYEEKEFTAFATATLQELEDAPPAVADRMIGDFLQALGVGSRYADAVEMTT